jgi:hydroxymethylglutaryl-CoA synthase
MNKKVLCFSYGSGLASSMFSFTIKGDVSEIKKVLNLRDRLDSRLEIEPADYDKIMNLREKAHNAKDYVPTCSLETIGKNSFYLCEVDGLFRRTYGRN